MKYLKVCLLSTLILIIFAGISYSQYRKDYKNGKFFYKFDYPNDWELSEMPSKDDPSTVKIVNKSGAGVLIIAKNSKANKGRSAHDLNLGDLVNTVKKSYNSAELLENEYGNFIEKPAIILKFTFLSPSNDPSVLTQYSFISGETYFCIQSYATNDNLSIDESLINSIIFSFAITAEASSNYVMNSVFGFSLTFPYGWKSQIKNIPYTSTNDEAVMVVDVNKDRQYEGFTTDMLNNEVFEDIIRQQYKGTEIFESKKIRINGEPCIFIRFSYPDKTNTNITKLHYYLIKNSILFIVEGTVNSTLISKYESVFDVAANSLKLF